MPTLPPGRFSFAHFLGHKGDTMGPSI